MQINQLTQLDYLSSGDQVLIYSSANGDTRRISANLFSQYVLSNQARGSKESAQYLAPNTSGFNVTIAPVTTGNNKWLKIMPAAALAAGTITLPDVTLSYDGQEVLVTTTQTITALSIAQSGAVAVYGAPTTLAANGFFKLRYDAVSMSWFRIG